MTISDKNILWTGKKVEEGCSILPTMDRNKYQKRSGLEGPFMARSGKVYYYDPAEGKNYDPDTDFYMSDEEFAAHDSYGLDNGDEELSKLKRLSSN